MESRSSHVYEIEFDVLGQCHDRYTLWLERDALDWFAHESVDGFEVHHSIEQQSPKIRFVFEFDSYQRWAEFVGSTKTELSIDQLETISSDVQQTLWKRDSISLSGPDGEPSTDESATTDRQRHRTQSWYQN